MQSADLGPASYSNTCSEAKEDCRGRAAVGMMPCHRLSRGPPLPRRAVGASHRLML